MKPAPQPPEAILVVDDNVYNRQLVEAQLEAAGYVVTCASSGEEALSLFSRFTPDLILLDIMMPHLNGFETFQKLRALPGGIDTPIVFLTSAADPATHKTALDLGASDFLGKPINRTELLIRVRSLLRVRRLHTELRHGYELIRTQRDELLRAQKQKEQLVAFVVNELHGTLAELRRQSDQLLADLALSDPSRLGVSRAAAQDISTLASSIQRTVMNLLDLSRSEEKELSLQLQELDVSRLLEQIFLRHVEHAQVLQRTLEISSEIRGQRFMADAELITRLVENLLDNALRYAPPGTVIGIAARALYPEQLLELRISDEGPPIPLEYRERIFDRSAQLHLEEDTHGPSRTLGGLGLAFCRLAAEAHGGRVFVEDNEPRGTVFCVQLPLLRPHTPTR